MRTARIIMVSFTAGLGLFALCEPVRGNEPTEGLIAHWKFDEGEGTRAYDSAGDNDGTIYGAQWTTGHIGGALEFDGQGNYVNFGDIDELEFGDKNFSISFWFYTKGPHDGGGGSGKIISKYNYGNGRQWAFSQKQFDAGRIYWYTSPDGTTREDLISEGSGYENEWVHVVGVRDGAMKLLYIDGVLDNTGPTGGVITGKSTAVLVGAFQDPSHTFNFFNGRIDDVRVYDRALSAGEIQRLYNRDLGGHSSPIAHWKFDEGEGTTALDSVGSNHGAIHGANWTTGRSACALDFDGVDDYVTTQVRDIDKLSVAAWVNVSGETLGDQQNIINNCENGGYTLSYDFNLNKKLVFAAHINGGYRTAFSDIIIQKHKWYHVVGTYDGKDGCLYVDGVKQADCFRAAGVITDTRLPLLVGANPETDGTIEYGRCFNGKVDDIRIYGRALSPEEIEQLYRSDLSGHSLQIGPMIVVNNIERAIREQVEEWKRIDDTLIKEWEAYEALEQMLQNGNYGDLSYDAILTARQQISTAIQHSQKSKESLEKSIEDLEAALAALGFELVPKASAWLKQAKLAVP